MEMSGGETGGSLRIRLAGLPALPSRDAHPRRGHPLRSPVTATLKAPLERSATPPRAAASCPAPLNGRKGGPLAAATVVMATIAAASADAPR